MSESKIVAFENPADSIIADQLTEFIRLNAKKMLKEAVIKVVDCLLKDKDELLTFYHYPAEHWKHLRTTNPIESTFATVRHRTRKSKNCLSRSTVLACVFKLCLEAEKRWQRLHGYNKIADVINLVEYKECIKKYYM